MARPWSPRRPRQSCPLPDLLAEDATRPEDQHEDQDHEQDGLRPALLSVCRGEDLDERDHEAAEHGAGEVADAAEDRGGERLQARVEPEVEAHEPEVLTLEDAR